MPGEDGCQKHHPETSPAPTARSVTGDGSFRLLRFCKCTGVLLLCSATDTGTHSWLLPSSQSLLMASSRIQIAKTNISHTHRAKNIQEKDRENALCRSMAGKGKTQPHWMQTGKKLALKCLSTCLHNSPSPFSPRPPQATFILSRYFL